MQSAERTGVSHTRTDGRDAVALLHFSVLVFFVSGKVLAIAFPYCKEKRSPKTFDRRLSKIADKASTTQRAPPCKKTARKKKKNWKKEMEKANTYLSIYLSNSQINKIIIGIPYRLTAAPTVSHPPVTHP